MTVARPTYCTREEVKAALDIKETARNNAIVDRAIQAASDSVEGLLHRVFYPTTSTKYFEWPNWSYAYPWRLWLEQNELATTATAVSSGGTTIALNQVFFEPVNFGPPYTSIELDRSTSASFGHGSTPQREVAITGQFGYWTNTSAAGTLAAAITDTTGTSVTGSSGIAVGVGDVIVVDTERMLVTEKSSVSTSQTQQGSGCSTASNADNALAVTDGTKYSAGEVLTLGTERMLVENITGNTLTVKRAWDGSVLATHSGATIYAYRSYTVVRGSCGTTAATHLNAAPISIAAYPGLVKQLSVAEAVVWMASEPGAYAMAQGSSDNRAERIGAGLPDLRDATYTALGRSVRTKAV
jgi:hypothetical protein